MAALGLFQIRAGAFEEFERKDSTRDLAHEMLKGLGLLSCDDFAARFNLSLFLDEKSFREKIQEDNVLHVALVFVDKIQLSFRSMVAKPPDLVCSKSMQSSNRQKKELAFLYWLSCLVALYNSVCFPSVPTTLELIAGNKKSDTPDLNVRIVTKLRTESLSNAVFKVVIDGKSDPLWLKIGHSRKALKTVHNLCLPPMLWNQVKNEGRILKRLKSSGCSLIPNLVFYGHWHGRPAVVTRNEGIPFLEQFPCDADVGTVEKLCKDLTEAVLVLHDHKVLHCDINPRNVGVYNVKTDRWFYLYDFGCALDLRRDEDASEVVGNLLFSSCRNLTRLQPNLVTELVSVVYTCLYVAGLKLPWEEAAAKGDLDGCCRLRDTFFREVDLSMFSQNVAGWLRFVLQQRTDARPRDIAAKYREYLGGD
ncbi:hypothetical protein SELMODRAFT_427339 [Selaginella moellendorffii]|uniref:Protein kinase domain-containing protein n=1 Tax=Selaginella moellendorffii TaxID=88036 RepID=D8SZ95_SELML|nr:hypothetical protein SELMODRAFT_427339 [Selaginella moellendorffii]